jgi:hypothetical protein
MLFLALLFIVPSTAQIPILVDAMYQGRILMSLSTVSDGVRRNRTASFVIQNQTRLWTRIPQLKQ